MTKIAIGLMSAVAAFSMGCAGEVQPEGTRERPTSSQTTFGEDDTTGAFSGVTVTLPKGVDAIRNATFNDIASYSFHVGDEQRVSQWLISGDGLAYRSRVCVIREEGVDWKSCSSWTKEHAISDLGLGNIGAVEGMSSFVINEGGREYLTKRFFTKFGSEEHEQTCLVDAESGELTECSPWITKTLADLGVEGTKIFRDDSTIVFKNDDGLNVVGQALLATDGTKVWQRECVIAAGELSFDDANCRFGENEALDHFNIPVNMIAGRSGFTYDAGGKVYYAETVFAGTKKDAGRRVCEVTTVGVDWNSCSAWEDVFIGTALQYNLPL